MKDFFNKSMMDNQIKDIESLGKEKGFKLLHVNVRSLMKKIDQIRLTVSGSKLDVITMSETWLNSSLGSRLVGLDDYVMYRQDRDCKIAGKKRGGGLLTYIHSKYANESEQLPDVSISSKHIEVQWSVIHHAHCRDTVIGNVYRPPAGKLEKAVEHLESCLLHFDLAKCDIFIMGDMNVNYKKKTSADYKKLNFFVKANGLKQVIMTTTRNNDKTQSLLDLVLTNTKYVSKAGTLDYYISDHQPIFVVKKKGRDNRSKVEFEGRSYRNFDRASFKQQLLDCNWGEFYKLEDSNLAWEYVLNQITPIVDRMCPVRLFQIKNYRPDWVTPELLEQIKDRDYFYKKAKSSGSEDDWNIAKHLRNTTNSNIRQARRDFVLSELNEHKTDQKKFWKTIRSVIPDEKGSVKQDILLKRDGVKIAREEVAPYVNEFFINIGNITSPTDASQPCRPTLPSRTTGVRGPSNSQKPGLWTFENFTENEVIRVVKSINTSKSSGIDNLSSFVLKEAFLTLTTQLTFLFNLTVKFSEFPAAWKEALVIPIPKGGNSTLVGNYRPISLLPLPGKLLEKLVHTQLMTHLEDMQYLSENQHGFRKNHSTVHSVAQITKYLNLKMDQGFPSLATFIDFRKAFDCVQHPVLLDKLSSLDLAKEVIDWFKSYLSHRRQRVLANNTYSSFQYITQGVPQGSVLGPLFYIIYANDISKVIKHCKIALYADDTVLYIGGADYEKIRSKMQQDVNALCQWCTVNGISMNVEKTKLMMFGNPIRLGKLPSPEIEVDDLLLKMVSHYKYLGMTLDTQLNYNKHVQKIIANVTGKLKQFRRMRSFLNTSAATMVYKNMILPLMEYGDIFLTGTSLTNRKRLQVLQNKGLRCALNKGRYASREELHTEADLLQLKYRRDLHMLNYMYDMSQTEGNLRIRRTEGVKTRSDNKKLLKIRKPRTEKYKKSLAYRGPKRWNDLSEDLHFIPTRSQFSQRLRGSMRTPSESMLA